ncbi:YitT family protein [Halotalea alkalilenta]|uniref:YitT family protein n=1 Tax=Halotalea alkalilenta TaxID=376489 RepID=UPI0006942105|nr:YitT family protein [Halotalea alkalilenta]
MLNPLSPRWRSCFTLFQGCLLSALGIHLLQSGGMLMSSTAGLGLLLERVTALDFALLFFIINLPFYLLGWRSLGRAFTLRTLACVTLLSLLIKAFNDWLPLGDISLPIAAIAAGLLLGVGLAMMFRENASLGGINILALHLERSRGWHAARTTACWDLALVAIAILVYSPSEIVFSLLAFAVLAVVLAHHHRKQSTSKAPARSEQQRLERARA